MENTEMMKIYEQETGISAIDPDELECYSREFVKVHTPEYVAWLEAELQTETIRADALKNAFDRFEAKAAAYDRLMSGGKKTLKEWANIFGLPFAVGRNGQGIAFKCKNLPIAAGNNWWPTDVGDFGFAFIDSSFIDFNGDWKDSLTLPDGWEA